MSLTVPTTHTTHNTVSVLAMAEKIHAALAVGPQAENITTNKQTLRTAFKKYCDDVTHHETKVGTDKNNRFAISTTDVDRFSTTRSRPAFAEYAEHMHLSLFPYKIRQLFGNKPNCFSLSHKVIKSPSTNKLGEGGTHSAATASSVLTMTLKMEAEYSPGSLKTVEAYSPKSPNNTANFTQCPRHRITMKAQNPYGMNIELR